MDKHNTSFPASSSTSSLSSSVSSSSSSPSPSNCSTSSLATPLPPYLPGISLSPYCLSLDQYAKLIHLQKDHPGYSRLQSIFDQFIPNTVRVSLQSGTQLLAVLSLFSLISAPNTTTTTTTTKRHLLLSRFLQALKQNGMTNLRIATALTVLISSCRFLRRSLDTLRSNVLKVSAPHVRKHYPYLYTLLMSRKVSAACSAAVAGYAAASVLPSNPDELRVSLGIYLATRYAEMIYNYLEDEGFTQYWPAWADSCLLLPLATQELFYNFIFHPSATPRMFRNLLMSTSHGYIEPRPPTYPQDLPWPNPDEIVDSIAQVARSHYNHFTSPMLKPKSTPSDLVVVPRQFASVAPLVSLAHPGITRLSAAILHPFEKSDFRNVLQYVIRQSGHIGKYMGAIYLVIGVVSKRLFSVGGVAGLVAQSAKYTSLLTLYLATLWGGTDIVYDIIPSLQIAPLLRFRLIGFVAGLWAFLDTATPGRKPYLMQSVRLAILSRYKLLTSQLKQSSPLKKTSKSNLLVSSLTKPQGQSALISLSLAGIMILMEAHPQAVAGPSLRKCLNYLRARPPVDPLTLDQDNTPASKDE